MDFNDALLQGSNNKQLPNQFYGLALLIEGNNITLKNARVSGYKVAVMAKDCKNLVIEGPTIITASNYKAPGSTKM